MPDTAYRTCPLCEATCGLELRIEGDRVTRIRGDRDNVFSGGFVCPKGTTLGRIHHDPDRLRRPRIRRPAGGWEEVSWEEAFAFIDRRFAEVVAAGGRQAVAVYLGNPNVHSLDNGLAVRPLVKAIGTPNVFSASTVDQMPKHVACGHMFGHPATIPVPDVDRTDHLLMLGANPVESNGSLATAPDWPGRLAALRERGGRLVVVDPRRTRTARLADEHVSIRPGTDAALLAAMIRHLLALGVPEAVRETSDGLGEVEAAVAGFTPEAVADFSGVPAATIRRLAEDLAGAERAVVYGRIGTHTVRFGTLCAWAVDVLNVITGNLDRPGGAMFPRPAHLPARRRVRPFETGRWRSRVRDLPEVMGELPVATLADEILTEGEGQVRALFVVGGNPALTNPDSARLVEALSGLDLMVSIDPYLNETSRLADVVLPPPSALERPHYDLAFTGLSIRNYAMFSPAVFPAEGPSEFDILVTLAAIASGAGSGHDPARLARADLEASVASAAAALGREVDDLRRELDRWDDPRLASLDLMLRTGPYGDGFGARPGGLSLATLAAAPHGVDLGPLEPRWEEAITTPNGRVQLAPPAIISDLPRLAAAMAAPVEDSLLLVGRRQLRTANSWLGNVEILVKGRQQCTLQIHPDDARRLGIGAGELAEVTSGVGRAAFPAEPTEDIRPGVVSLPYGWGHDLEGVELSVARRYPGGNVNLLTSTELLDPLSGNAVLNAVPVSVRPLPSV